MNRFLILLLMGALFFSACKSSGLLSNSGRDLKKRNAKFLLEQLEKNRLDYDWYAAKAKVKFEDASNNIGFIVNMRIRHDSIIWLTIKKMSVEGLRVLISPDRLEVLNRQDNQYVVEPISAIRKQLAMPLGFSELENLLVGNPIFMEGIKFEVVSDSTHYILLGDIPDSKDPEKTIGEIKLWLNGDTYLLERIEGKVDANTFSANFSDYQLVGEKKVAFEKDILVTTPEAGKVRMQISINKIDLNEEQKIQFEVPDHYEKVISGNKK